RNEDIQEKLRVTDWDVIVVDEAHKMSATHWGGEVRFTKRYQLGRLLGEITRHFLLLTATPHNGKEEDFQLFLALLDADRFEGRFRDGVHVVDISDIMRRMVKEDILRFDGSKLFPERRAYTVNYKLSDLEAHLYQEVTEYVRDGMNRADRLRDEGEGRRGNTVGFALQILQRRLASSPEAIYRSLTRRRIRLERRLEEEKVLRRGASARIDSPADEWPAVVEDDFDDDDTNAAEREELEEKVVDRATAARTIAELQTEIATLVELERLAAQSRRSGTDRKWEELSSILQGTGDATAVSEVFDVDGSRRKLIIFTEHRDTLDYLTERIRGLLGRPEAVITIHGGVGREDRRKAQELFTQDKDTLILVATDAAGEGLNLQRAHLMVNYDLPWNPNRIEQRFGRIHRIGQAEVCHLWNLVANETREGDVYQRLLEKMEQQRESLQGSVFDVLGKCFTDEPLRDLLIQAVRYGDRPEVRAQIREKVDAALDTDRLAALIEERALVHDALDHTRLLQIKEEMERAQLYRLQPHFIGSFFREAFTLLGGSMSEREGGRYEVRRVPAAIRQRDRQIGTGQVVTARYERVTFDRDLLQVDGKPPATFVCPGHPLFDATLDLVRERYADLLRRGTVLVDPHASDDNVRALFCLSHSIQDGKTNADGKRRVVSQRLQFVDVDSSGAVRDAGPAPHLDSAPIDAADRTLVNDYLEADWLTSDLEASITVYAIDHLVPPHLTEVRERRVELAEKTRAAVKDRLAKEITHWDHRATELAERERAGRTSDRLNSIMARRRAEELQERLRQRMDELDQEVQLSPMPPTVIGGALVVPLALLRRLRGESSYPVAVDQESRERIDRMAMAAVMAAESAVGREPLEMPHHQKGFDITSFDPAMGRTYFIEVKGKAAESSTVTISRSQILHALNHPEQFILAIVEVDGEHAATPMYIRQPFSSRPDFHVASANFDLSELREMAQPPS
ncbi:DUF3883 domain-containing protein, partial [Candidatus Poribacteria bacterium]|nr:DUF3883 domain-containing protein [Candidatus Poribacteria bacterium]